MIESSLFSLPLRIYVEDTDSGGIVYHANYLNFMERSRSHWLEQIPNVFDTLDSNELMFVVTQANMSFCRPAKLRDNIISTVDSIELRVASITIYQSIFLKAKEPDAPLQLLVNAKIIVALIHKSTLRATRISKILQNQIESCCGR